MASGSQNESKYDVIKDSVIGRRFTRDEFEKLKDEGLEIDLENKDDEEDAKIFAEQEEREKKEFYENLASSPYPQSEDKYADCVTFLDRCRLMVPVANSKDRIFKSVIRPAGKSARVVTEEDAVLFHINAFIVESYDEPFDSTYARKKPLLSKLNRVLKGYALSLLTMKVGEMAEFAIHRSLAYGELGCPPRIPPASDIIVIMEVMDIFARGSIEYFHSLSSYEQEDHVSSEQIMLYAQEDRKKGSDFYREEDYRQAVYYYRRAIDLLERNFSDTMIEDESNRILMTLYHNAANCQIKLDHGPAIVNYARRALRIDPDSAKANYQLGKGYMKLNKLERARMFLTKAQKLRPFDPDINAELGALNHKLAAENMDTKNLYVKMAQALVVPEDEDELPAAERPDLELDVVPAGFAGLLAAIDQPNGGWLVGGSEEEEE